MAYFKSLPSYMCNSYQVRTDDDGPYGNDETRCFLLTTFSYLTKTTMACVVCRMDMLVYDKYPLINGTFFLSSESYDGCAIELSKQQQQQYLNAVCIGCMNAKTRKIVCKFCRKEWKGNSLVIGSMYNYDIFGAMSCCSQRFNCRKCGNPTRDFPPKDGRFFCFSDCTKMATCGRCGLEAQHSIKPLAAVFDDVIVNNNNNNDNNKNNNNNNNLENNSAVGCKSESKNESKREDD
ncbi:hypothetical protein HELRODRAFT_116498 [Helobdella robusta]|uniref:Headcase middle domain-containing protein n=1 Tax=Helobdella robusta TaxID=6412 RepID=T1EGF4_HELRO|nr:hypothetical protein HELRODRAFT_116498 [Helobdella robusta]ESN90839.1 hypothetical protein HELRODRAFT_116498 [Helobdella robusta]